MDLQRQALSDHTVEGKIWMISSRAMLVAMQPEKSCFQSTWQMLEENHQEY